jgi:cytochrome c oxidase assembly protein subunit 15
MSAQDNPYRPPSDPAPPAASYRPGVHWMALAALLCTWPLLFAGGLVTTYRVGMAVPDWPTTFNENMLTYDFLDASFGVQVEHVHRLFGAAVGMVMIALAGWLLWAEPRGYVKALGVLALLGVIGQGVLGGIRVTENSTLLAMIHGCTGQLFFGLIAALAVVTGRAWLAPRDEAADAGGLRWLALATAAVVYAQTCAGAWLRHHLAGLEVHVALAILASAGVLATGHFGFRSSRPLRAPAVAMTALLLVQVGLGVSAWWLMRPFDGIPHPVTAAQAFVRTGHQANGALLFATTVAMALLASRHAAPSGRAVPARGPALEAVAS